MFDPYKKLVVDFYTDAYFTGLRGHENNQDPVFSRSRTGFVVNFPNFPLLWVSQLQIYIDLSTLYYEYVELYHYVRALIPFKILIK